MLSNRQRTAFYNDSYKGHKLTPEEREQVMSSLLPDPISTPNSPSTSPYPSRDTSRTRSASSKNIDRRANMAPATATRKRERRKPIRTALKQGLYVFIYTVIHFFFSIYIRLRKAGRALVHRAYAIGLYHHRTPQLIRNDIKGFKKVPQHLSVVVQLNNEDDIRSSLQSLVQDIGELTAWSAAVGIPVLSIYEKSGVLKRCIPQAHNAIAQTLHRYFGTENRPHLRIRSPNQPVFSPPNTPPDESNDGSSPSQITVLFLSEDDGRSTIVDLTKVLATMAQRQKIAPEDINADVINSELSELVMGEPDLLVLFGPDVRLEGYPPWQVRLTEIFHVPDYTEGVSYAVFMRALNKFAGAQMRFGR